MYTSPSYDGVIYVAMPALKGLRGQQKYLWFRLEGNGTPKSVTADTVPYFVRKRAATAGTVSRSQTMTLGFMQSEVWHDA
jgi:hypothetical protein